MMTPSTACTCSLLRKEPTRWREKSSFRAKLFSRWCQIDSRSTAHLRQFLEFLKRWYNWDVRTYLFCNLFYMQLMKDEEIIYETRVWRWVGWFWIVFWIITLLAFIGVIFIVVWAYMLSKRYILTNKRFIIKTWFSSKEMRIDKIESFNKKGLLWTVIIHGTWSGTLNVTNVEKPQELLNHIHRAIDNLKK